MFAVLDDVRESAEGEQEEGEEGGEGHVAEEEAELRAANAVVLSQTQRWSCVSMQASQTRQWCARGGRQMLQLLQFPVGTSIARAPLGPASGEPFCVAGKG